MKEIYKRIVSDTPLFFKRIQIFGVFLGSVSSYILTNSDSEYNKRMAERIGLVSITCIAVSQFAKKDTNESDSTPN